RPEDGVVNLALGLGKTIVDGSLCWTYCPEMPRVPPPTNSVADLVRQTQNDFWAINMRPSTHYDPTKETEHMCLFGLKDAEYDNTLTQVASTYRPESDSLMVGTYQAGPRVITFAPILDAETLPLNRLVKNTLAACEKSLQNAVEIEFALSHDRENNRYQFGFLQVRPMVVCHTTVDLTAEISQPERCVVRSNKVLGNGLVEGLTHIVYVKPLAFDPAQTRLIASEIAAINQTLQQQQQPYVLIGFGRWGSSDPWLGIPVRWSDICQAKVIVEATLSNMNVDLSQGSHFFHNINGFQVSYFTVSHNDPGIDWNWLDHCQVVSETKYVRHICVSAPLTVKVDGRSQQGVIHK
ncbi:MAG TPA: hypothetical protein VJC18_01445, partial [bacterium]|nr:hypothetical protein [bacterium]